MSHNQYSHPHAPGAPYPPQPYQVNPVHPQPGAYPPQHGAYPPQHGAYPPQPAAYYPHPGVQSHHSVPHSGDHSDKPTKGDPSRVAIDMNLGSGAIAATSTGDDGTGANYLANVDAMIRNGFVRKVYTILLAQLLVTFGFVALFTFHEGIRDWVQSSPKVLISAAVVSIVLVFALVCCQSVARKYPGNYICLSIFTLAESYLVGALASYYHTNSVVKAIIATLVIVVALTIYAMKTKTDFTMKRGLIICACICLIMFAIAAAIWRNEIMSTLYGAVGALVFSFFIVVDTQMIIGGTHRVKFTVDEYVFAALSLYLDVINLFLHLLRLFGDRR